MTLETTPPLLHHAMGYDPPDSPLRLLPCVDDRLWQILLQKSAPEEGRGQGERSGSRWIAARPDGSSGFDARQLAHATLTQHTIRAVVAV
jgi:hypothetical protein